MLCICEKTMFHQEASVRTIEMKRWLFWASRHTSLVLVTRTIPYSSVSSCMRDFNNSTDTLYDSFSVHQGSFTEISFCSSNNGTLVSNEFCLFIPKKLWWMFWREISNWTEIYSIWYAWGILNRRFLNILVP